MPSKARSTSKSGVSTPKSAKSKTTTTKKPKKDTNRVPHSRSKRMQIPTLSDAERRAKERLLLLDMPSVRKILESVDIKPPEGLSKLDMANLYATAAALRRIEKKEPFPPLPSLPPPARTPTKRPRSSASAPHTNPKHSTG